LTQDDALEAPVYLDAIVALVDAQHFLHQLAAQVMRQLAFADRIVVNKLDLVDQTQIANISAAVRNINSVAPVMHATRSNIDLSFIVDTRAFNTHSVDAPATSMSDTPAHQCTSECSHAASPCAHDDSIRTLVLEQRDANVRIDLIKFRQFLADLLWEPAANGYAPAQEIFRMKAVLHSLPDSDSESDDEFSSDSDSSESDQQSVSTSGSRHYLQAVQQLFEIERGLPWAHSEVPFTRMIVIGRHIDEPRLSAAFAKSWIRL
jgi:G3E family GTPase